MKGANRPCFLVCKLLLGIGLIGLNCLQYLATFNYLAIKASFTVLPFCSVPYIELQNNTSGTLSLQLARVSAIQNISVHRSWQLKIQSIYSVDYTHLLMHI